MTSITNGLQLGDTETKDHDERNVLPREFLKWQSEARLSLYRTFTSEGIGAVKTMPSHLAVIGTSGPDGSINLATKGIGLVPRKERLDLFTSEFRSTIERCRGREWSSTLYERVRTLLSFYQEVDNFDDSRLGGLEIFEGATYENLRSDSRASLLFSGEAPGFLSYQIDGTVEFVEKGDPYYEFLSSARGLFANDRFHVPQTYYPHGFIINVRSVKDKRPTTRSGPHV